MDSLERLLNKSNTRVWYKDTDSSFLPYKQTNKAFTHLLISYSAEDNKMHTEGNVARSTHMPKLFCHNNFLPLCCVR